MSYEPTLDDLIAKLRHDTDAEIRRNAAWLLGRQRDPRIVPPLIAALQDSDAGVRLRAAEALSSLKAPESLYGLIGTLSDTDADVRAMAAEALGYLGDARATEALTGLLGDESAEVRTATVRALGGLGADSALESLVEVWLRDDDETVAYAVSHALTRLSPRPTIQILFSRLDELEDRPEMLLKLIKILAHLRDKSGLEILKRLENHPDDAVRGMTLWGIIRLS